MILYNANLVTFWPSTPYIEGALLAVEGKTVVDFGKMGKLIDRYEDSEVLDAGGRLVLPGMIDAHSRLWRCLAPGASGDARRLPSVLDAEAIYASAVVALLDGVRHGITTVFALHSSPARVSGSLEELRRAFADVGVRGAVGYAVSSASNVVEAMSENLSSLSASHEMFHGLFGLEVGLDLDDRVLERCAEAADAAGARFHVALGDSRDELDASLSLWGASPVGRLAKLVLWPRVGFCIRAPHRLPADEATLRESGVWLVDCPQAEMIARAPAPELAHLRAADTRVAMGTDGLGGGILGAFRLAALRQRARGTDLESAIRLALSSSLRGNAEMATAHFGPPLGSIRPGARADLVVFDYVPSTPLDESSIAEHLFWGVASAPVHSVVVNGRLLYQNGQFTSLDETRLRARAREIAKILWERL